MPNDPRRGRRLAPESAPLPVPGAYQVEAWIQRLGSVPVETIAYADHSEGQTMKRAWALRLESGRFALVVESGCSCYESRDAEIEQHPSKRAVLAAFQKWEKQARPGGA